MFAKQSKKQKSMYAMLQKLRHHRNHEIMMIRRLLYSATLWSNPTKNYELMVKLTLRFLRSISKRSFRPGLCTLITTSWPFSLARCTWPAKETNNLFIPFNQLTIYYHMYVLSFLYCLNMLKTICFFPLL